MTTPVDVVPVARWEEKGAPATAAYEHPLFVRLSHWMTAVSLVVMAASGLRIFLAFPSFGDKVPQEDFIWHPPPGITLGGWLGGALQWHFTFMWVFAAAAAMYLAGQLLSGRYRMVLFTPRDVPGVWPMARHYFLRGARPVVDQPYNPLQKLAYTSTLLFGLLSLVSGLALYKSTQLPWLVTLLGGYRLARIWHFVALCGFAAFIPGHLVMVALHGWRNFAAMLTGWKRDPEYLREVPIVASPILAAAAPSAAAGAPNPLPSAPVAGPPQDPPPA